MSSTETHNQHSQVKEIGPALLSELNDCGIKNSSLDVISDMVSLEDSGKAIDLILKMSRSHKSKFLIKSGMVVYHNAEDNLIFGIDEHLQSSYNVPSSEYEPLNDISDNKDFQQRKEMREALRGR
jgi:hypothetical protein